MAIGTGLALGLGAAAIGGVGSAISSGNNRRAINDATDAQTQSNAQSLALMRQVRGENQQYQQPFYQTGLAANNALNDLYGLNPENVQNQPQQNALAPMAGGPNASNGYFTQGDLREGGGTLGINLPSSIQQYFGGPTLPNANQPQTAQPAQTAAGQTQGQSFNDGFRNYIDNSDYAFNLGEGFNAINSGYAGAGTLQSGAAMRGIEDYRQNLQAGYRNEYIGGLRGQQMVGVGAANALAGIGTNYANNAAQINQNNANALSNAAVARANNNNALVGGITSGIGSVAGLFS